MFGTRRAPRRSFGATAIASSPWIVVSIGVIVMVVLLFVALGAYRERDRGADARLEPPVPTAVLPELSTSPTGRAVPTSAPPARPGLSPRTSVLPTGQATPARPSPAGGGPAPTPSASSAAPVTGRYAVATSFDGGFVGEVRLTNGSRTDRGWTARLAFPGGRVVTAWVEGAPQGTLTRTDDGFTYRSGVDIAPGGSATLRFHIEQADSRPASCTVDGVECSGL
ncbi:cellulose binding domain-containing protein [Micromonospora deserti]|uniref:Cellulose-binding protein n=1 Tax=Micromonospora deserti TaxID=2070366 RepID=A0A2W2CIX9_9ACTN|nr:cellulose binding domain-containing protein [Micromonospora deserti]PZF98462.1 cellulose-binding protein [Micromonospora deserti]